MPTFKHPCPACGKLIARDAARCPLCGSVDPFVPGRCPKCQAPIEDAASVACAKCGTPLKAGRGPDAWSARRPRHRREPHPGPCPLRAGHRRRRTAPPGPPEPAGCRSRIRAGTAGPRRLPQGPAGHRLLRRGGAALPAGRQLLHRLRHARAAEQPGTRPRHGPRRLGRQGLGRRRPALRRTHGRASRHAAAGPDDGILALDRRIPATTRPSGPAGQPGTHVPCVGPPRVVGSVAAFSAPLVR